MLPKENRLTDDYDFRRVRRLGKSFHTPLFVLTIAPAKDSTTLRFGFITSTKLDKRAVARNRVKRLLREAVHKRLGDFKPGSDIVVVGKKGVVGKKCEDVEREMGKVLEKVSF